MDEARQFTGGGIYVFAGGFTIGSARYFRPLFHFEGNKYGVSTFQANFPDVPVYLPTAEWPLSHYANKVDYVWANPPCAIFSTVGQLLQGGDTWRKDPRVQCWKDTVDAVKVLQPRVFAIESVTRAYSVGTELMNTLAEEVLPLGYAVTHLLVDAQYLGLHQRRKRYFFIGHKVQIPWTRPNYEAKQLSAGELLTAYEATYGNQHDLDDPAFKAKPAYRALIAQFKQGESARGGWERLNPPETWVRTKAGVKGRPRIGSYRLDPHGIMPTFIGDTVIHPTEDRHLTNREMTFLMSYPLEYQFPVRAGEIPSLLARGVTPTVAAWLAQHVYLALTINSPVTRTEVQMLDLRKPFASFTDLMLK